MQIQGQASAAIQASQIQRIQAQQAFPSKAKTQANQPANELQDIAVSTKPLKSSLPSHIFTPNRLSEIKDIAAQAGYVGLENADIERAYSTGSSLLTDYRA